MQSVQDPEASIDDYSRPLIFFAGSNHGVVAFSFLVVTYLRRFVRLRGATRNRALDMKL